jgi:hypothetical protein
VLVSKEALRVIVVFLVFDPEPLHSRRDAA